MRYLGYVLITIGLALVVFLLWSWLSDRNKVISPVPEGEGVRVIFISPSQ